LDSLEEVCKQKEIDLKREIIGSNFDINSDGNKLSQIIKNLLSNAIKFTSKGYVKLTIKELNDFIQVEVIDTGIGIEQKDLLNIFDRFNQIDDSRTRKFGGTGLGLTISKELANLLCCKLEVNSEFSQGTIFTLTIPKNIPNKIFGKEDRFINKKEVINKFESDEKNILIMCSNSVEQFKYAIALKKENFKVVPFFDSDEFYLKIGNFLNKNSLIIVDDNVKNFNLIFEDYKKILNFIVISNKKYDDVILNLNEKDSFELLFQQIKTYLKNINQ
jgi:anti-sigma regulatory factor (Ser/Thr protein kinase)